MEEMNYIFGVSTYRHIKYQVNEVLPWCVDYYLKGHKDKNPCPFLYRRARDAGDEGDQNEGGEKTNGEGRGGAGNSIALQSSRSNA